MPDMQPDWAAIMVDPNAPRLAKVAASLIVSLGHVGEIHHDIRDLPLSAEDLDAVLAYVTDAGYSVKRGGDVVTIKRIR